MKHLKFSFIVLALSALLAGCMSAEPSSGLQDDQAQDEIHFLRQKPSDAPDMEALIEGRLVLSKKCLYIQSEDVDSSYAAIWPFEFSLAVEGDSIQILNGDEEVVAQVGDQVRVGGGEIRPRSQEEFEQSYIGTFQCSGLYWLVGEVVEATTP